MPDKSSNSTTNLPEFPALVNEKHLHRLTGRSLSSIRKDRCRGTGVPFIKWPSGQILYDLRDIVAYLEANKRQSTSAPSAKTPDYRLSRSM